MKILLDNIHLDRRRWLELRKTGLGSSEIAAVCGLNTYDSPLKIWAEKTGKIPVRDETEQMWLGKMMEPITAAMFNRRTGLPVRAANTLCAHDEEEWQLASPDFMVDTPNGEKVLEAKFTTPRNRHIWTDGIPEVYMVQLNWQLGVCDIDFGFISAMIGGDPDDFKRFEHEFNPELHELMQEDGFKFMQLVKQDIPPQANAGDTKLLMKLQGERVEQTMKLEGKALSDFQMFEQWRSERYERNREVKAADLEYDRFKARLIQHMGNKIYGELPDGRVVSAKTQTNHGSVTKPFRFVDVKVKKPVEKIDV